MTTSVDYLQQLEYTLAWIAANPHLVAAFFPALVVVWWLVRRVVRAFTPDPVRREFRRSGIQPTQDQVEALRDAFATITADGAQKELQSRLNIHASMKQDRAHLERVKQLSQAHIEVVREVGSALQTLEQEYLKCRKALTSEQAKEALRLVVERSVAQITEMSNASAAKLPEFDIHPPRSQNGHGKPE